MSYLDNLLGVVKTCDLPLTCNEETTSNGACFYLCLKDQISRSDISHENLGHFEALDAKAKQMYLNNLEAWQKYKVGNVNHRPGKKFKYLTAWSLRNLVCDLVQFWKDNEICGRKQFLTLHSETCGKSIDQLIAFQRSDLEWAQDLFIDAAVELLQVPIWMFTEYSTKEYPFPIEKGTFFRQKSAMIIGSWKNQHFQSFIPTHLISLSDGGNQNSSSVPQSNDETQSTTVEMTSIEIGSTNSANEVCLIFFNLLKNVIH